jgi:hypothetical protein
MSARFLIISISTGTPRREIMVSIVSFATNDSRVWRGDVYYQSTSCSFQHHILPSSSTNISGCGVILLRYAVTQDARNHRPTSSTYTSVRAHIP